MPRTFLPLQVIITVLLPQTLTAPYLPTFIQRSNVPATQGKSTYRTVLYCTVLYCTVLYRT